MHTETVSGFTNIPTALCSFKQSADDKYAHVCHMRHSDHISQARTSLTQHGTKPCFSHQVFHSKMHYSMVRIH